MSLALTIANAVKTELNSAPAGSFEIEFTAETKLIPAYELSELQTLKITVVPKTVSIAASTRSQSQYDISVDIGIQKRVGKNVEEDSLPLLKLADDISDYLRNQTLADAPWAKFLSVTNDPIYDPGLLIEKRTFTGVLTLTYRAIK